MDIGKKIKKLRTDKFMTQSELAGSEITRNMLSCIENGSASPSLKTVKYLASRLNVPVGFLLAEDTDEELYTKAREILGIKKSYLSGDFSVCREACLSSVSLDDDEVMLILSECDLELGIEKFRKGELHEAGAFFDEAIENCSKTIYNTVHIVAMAAAYFRYMRYISATVSSEMIEESEIDIYPSFTDRFSKYVFRFESEENNHVTSTSKDLEGMDGDIYELHLSARRLMRSKKFGNAYEKLKRILTSDENVPKPMFYFVFDELEECCRECGDFKGAYEYSQNKVEHLQSLIS